MKNSYLTFINLFMAQPQTVPPQMGQPQPAAPQGGNTPSIRGVEAFALPVGQIRTRDMSRIQALIEEVLNKISESVISAGNRADYQTIKWSALTFQDWLRRQGCVIRVSTTYDIEATDTYHETIFMTYPGQLPFDIVFNMEGDVQKSYRLLIFITSFDLFAFASLVENKSLGGVAVPPNWPEDPWSYWEDRH